MIIRILRAASRAETDADAQATAESLGYTIAAYLRDESIAGIPVSVYTAEPAEDLE